MDEREIALADAMERFENVKRKRLSEPQLHRICPLCKTFLVAHGDKLCFQCKKI